MSTRHSKRSAWIKRSENHGHIFSFGSALLDVLRLLSQPQSARVRAPHHRERTPVGGIGRDTDPVERILANDFLGVDPKGNLYDRTKMISGTREAPKFFISNRLNRVKIRFYSDVAIAQGSESWEQRTDERGRLVWTDTWIRRSG